MTSYYVPNYSYPTKEKIEIDADLLGQCLAIETINFNPQFPIKFNISKGACASNFDSDQFIDYLAAFPNRHCDYKTGYESILRDWILNQKDNSIDPVMLFRQSIKLNSGDPWAATLTIHQLLRNEARWAEKKFYTYKSNEEKEHQFFNKMIDIRGDLSELGGDNAGDHEGTWYRIWGIMLYRFQLSGSNVEKIDTSKISECMNIPRTSLKRLLSDLKSSSIAIAAEGVKLLGATEGEKDWRKIEINRKGSQAASSFIKAATYLKDTRTDPDLLERCSKRQYLKTR